ncbi:hypothetical protein FDC58_15050 [Clostridium botulinum]|uniref:Uncharacterized protein n=1 Tax=Clostridium botulinum TaxID=1491 RepID=A0A0A0UV87_CLOBO|nr:hypothetical protein [Clostridium botulinum]AIW54594.1 hypothetical protein [Clostridium botulinum]AIW54714.1 hypothetical protein [Clostridium botulinum]AIW54776.1 hypothetical protein [Clostridium botulinum]AIW54843.1 hypothetical protein [Clostridium botulinum]MBY7009285.1 hypothetical protein [Clostridium botulinum]
MAQLTKTVSVRKTDSPLIEKFIKEQSNFSESVRYLILKYCQENGVDDISFKLNELMYNITIPTKKYNEKINENNICKNEYLESEDAKKELSIDKINVEEKENIKSIPSCYQ